MLKFAQKPETQPEKEAIRVFERGMANVLDLIAPAGFVIRPNYIQLSEYYLKTIFVYTYPRYLYVNWLSPIINADISMDVSMFIYPLRTPEIVKKLTKKTTEFESSLRLEQEKGVVRSPEIETALADVEALRDYLARGETKLFQFGLYFTLYAKTLEELEKLCIQLETALGGLFYTKQAMLQMEQGFNSTLPLCDDQLKVWRNLDSGSLSTTFPFTSPVLMKEEGIFYGINMINNSLIIFDRFSLENANSVCFATSGAGKSFALKIEALRYLMLGVDIIVIDPENEYKTLCEAVGGEVINISLKSPQAINPFDLPPVTEGESGQVVLNENVALLKGLIATMIGRLTPEEDAILEKAIFETYALKDITGDPESQKNPPPLLSDLYSVLVRMKGGEHIAIRLSKYIEGIYADLFNKPTSVDLTKRFITFSIRDLDEALRPIAMYTIIHYIWNRIRREFKKRILIIDEAWWMMQYEDSAMFLYSIARRARKYWLGLSIISQDVEDFLTSKYGRAVVGNASIQLLLKQSPSAINKVTEAFKLTKGEEEWLLTCDVGEGLLFAGLQHVVIKILASPSEYNIITSKPEEVARQKGI